MSGSPPEKRPSCASSKATISEARTRRAQARIGQLLCGKWRLDRLLGVGGMAAVYAATNEAGERAAIKTLHADLAQLPEVHERFAEEAHLARRISHPGVVAVRDESTSEDGTIFLVMDLCEGETLDVRCNWGAGFSPREVLEVADQILCVLVTAHDKGIIHRDIKPENVLLTADGRVKVLDFGVARVTDSHRTYTTEAGATIGTPAFMPPEQARGHWDKIDGRTDIWSLGATMYFMLTGRLVREAETPNEELLSAMTEPVPSIREMAAVPQALADIVDRALAFRIQDRYLNARAMQSAVRHALTTIKGSGALPLRVPLARTARRMRRAKPARAPEAQALARPGRNQALAGAAQPILAVTAWLLSLVLSVGLVAFATALAPEPRPRDARNEAARRRLEAALWEPSQRAVIGVALAQSIELPPEEDQFALPASERPTAEDDPPANPSPASDARPAQGQGSQPLARHE